MVIKVTTVFVDVYGLGAISKILKVIFQYILSYEDFSKIKKNQPLYNIGYYSYFIFKSLPPFSQSKLEFSLCQSDINLHSCSAIRSKVFFLLILSNFTLLSSGFSIFQFSSQRPGEFHLWIVLPRKMLCGFKFNIVMKC